MVGPHAQCVQPARPSDDKTRPSLARPVAQRMDGPRRHPHGVQSARDARSSAATAHRARVMSGDGWRLDGWWEGFHGDHRRPTTQPSDKVASTSSRRGGWATVERKLTDAAMTWWLPRGEDGGAVMRRAASSYGGAP
jgi:hypothetical protein